MYFSCFFPTLESVAAFSFLWSLILFLSCYCPSLTLSFSAASYIISNLESLGFLFLTFKLLWVLSCCCLPFTLSSCSCLFYIWCWGFLYRFRGCSIIFIPFWVSLSPACSCPSLTDCCFCISFFSSNLVESLAVFSFPFEFLLGFFGCPSLTLSSCSRHLQHKAPPSWTSTWPADVPRAPHHPQHPRHLRQSGVGRRCHVSVCYEV